MAINTGTSTINESVKSTQTQQPMGHKLNDSASGKWGFFSTRLNKHQINFTSEKLKKIVTMFTNTCVEMNLPNDSKLSVIPVDRNDYTDLYLSSVIFALHSESVGKTIYHTVLVEDSNDVLQPVVDTVNGQQRVIERFSSEVFNDVYKAVTRQIVKDYFNVPEDTIITLQGSVLNRGFNYEDSGIVYSATLNAVISVFDKMGVYEPGFLDFNLGEYKNDARLEVTLDLNNSSTTSKFDSYGLPVRSNVIINVVGKEIGNNNNNRFEINSGDRTTPVSTVYGFMDSIYVNNSVKQNYFDQQNQVTDKRKLAPRFVITSMENHTQSTPASQLFALATAHKMAEGYNWVSAFTPKQGKRGKGVDLTDIAAFDYEANVFVDPKTGNRVPLDTKVSTFTPEVMMAYIGSIFTDRLSISLDVSSCGADSWYNNIFLEASKGNVAATQAIVDAANVLTGGAFGTIWKPEYGVISPVREMVHSGHYIDDSGDLRDIRDIDMLAILNLSGNKDRQGDANNGAPQLSIDWTDTINNNNISLEEKLYRRHQIYKQVLPNSLVITGTVARVTASGMFMHCLVTAIAATNVNIVSTFNNVQMSNQQRSSWESYSTAAIQNTAGTVFGNQNQYYGASQNTNSRYL